MTLIEDRSSSAISQLIMPTSAMFSEESWNRLEMLSLAMSSRKMLDPVCASPSIYVSRSGQEANIYGVKGNGRVNVFSFVTFTRPDMADLAVQQMVSWHTLRNLFQILTKTHRTESPWVVAEFGLSASRAVTDRSLDVCGLV